MRRCSRPASGLPTSATPTFCPSSRNTVRNYLHATDPPRLPQHNIIRSRPQRRVTESLDVDDACQRTRHWQPSPAARSDEVSLTNLLAGGSGGGASSETRP